ncbi:hypothetical protein LINPERHAP1_LOCUS11081, partial [Linum perenne]
DAGKSETVELYKCLVRSRCGPRKIRGILNQPSITASKLLTLTPLGFSGTTQVQFGSLFEDFNKWALHCYDPERKSFEFMKDDFLTVTADDVAMVYSLPNGPKSVDKKVSESKSSKLTELAIANGLPIDTNAKEMVSQDKIKERLLNEIDDVKWSKMMILYIISVLLCPKAHLDASIKYLPLLEEGCVRQFSNYNWCQYVVDHFHKGFKKAKNNNLKKGTTQMFVGADINLLMVCFCEKYGPPSVPISPLCAKWDNEKFKNISLAKRNEEGNTFPQGPHEESIKLPKPFKGLMGNLSPGWGDLQAQKQQPILDWLEMAKRVIE